MRSFALASAVSNDSTCSEFTSRLILRGTVEGHSDNPYNSWYTYPATRCGEECLSGPNPCQPSAAWTNGQVACLCNDTSRCA